MNDYHPHAEAQQSRLLFPAGSCQGTEMVEKLKVKTLLQS
jgi:hypothetical protein